MLWWELTDFSIFPTVLFTFFLLALITPLLKKVFKRLAPTSRELALTYIMVSVATALAGHDIVRQLVPMIANAGWFATPENEWADLFFRFMPTWLTITDRGILQGYFEGDDSFWQQQYMEAWLWAHRGVERIGHCSPVYDAMCQYYHKEAMD